MSGLEQPLAKKVLLFQPIQGAGDYFSDALYPLRMNTSKQYQGLTLQVHPEKFYEAHDRPMAEQVGTVFAKDESVDPRYPVASIFTIDMSKDLQQQIEAFNRYKGYTHSVAFMKVYLLPIFPEKSDPQKLSELAELTNDPDIQILPPDKSINEAIAGNSFEKVARDVIGKPNGFLLNTDYSDLIGNGVLMSLGAAIIVAAGAEMKVGLVSGFFSTAALTAGAIPGVIALAACLAVVGIAVGAKYYFEHKEATKDISLPAPPARGEHKAYSPSSGGAAPLPDVSQVVRPVDPKAQAEAQQGHAPKGPQA